MQLEWQIQEKALFFMGAHIRIFCRTIEKFTYFIAKRD